MAQRHLSDGILWYVNEVTSRVVAKSGIPTDRFHIGKIVLQSFKDDPDFICQIDGATGESETNGSILKRSIQCAVNFKKMGLKQGDVMVLMAPNHLDLAVPFYAAMYLGIICAPVDRTLKVGELERTFRIYKPSIVFCQSEKEEEVETALKAIGLSTKVLTFESRPHKPCLAELLKASDEDIRNFRAADFNAEETIGWILPTSGSTGFPKGAALTYKAWMYAGPHIWARFTKFPSPISMWMVLSPLQWLTATVQYIISPFMKYTRLQTSKPVTEDLTRYLINTYRPTSTIWSSTMMARFLKPENQKLCDLTCFNLILIGGSTVSKENLRDIKIASPKTTVVNAYGMTELPTIVFQGDCPVGSAGKPTGLYQYRLINLDTFEDINEPGVNGELWLKGPGMFQEYYNNPEATKEAFSEDGWYKTGDLFYRDENWNFFFVDRIKMLMKYKHHQISPAEIEGVIREHPGVLDVAVSSVSDPECGDLPVSFIIPKPGFNLAADEIKNLVKEKLSDAKQLRGGVIFTTAFPLTATAKVDRKKLNEMIQEMKVQ